MVLYHLWFLSDINSIYIVGKLNRDTIRVMSINRMNKPVINNIRYRKSCRLQPILQRPQVVLCLNSKGDVVKDERPAYRTTVLFLSYRFNTRPLKKGDEVGVGNLKEVVPLAWLSQTSHQAHAQQVSPETNGHVHVSGSHSQVVHSIKPSHFVSSLSCETVPVYPSGTGGSVTSQQPHSH